VPVNDQLAGDTWQRFRYCVSGSARVVTQHGYVQLRNITAEHLVFDGVEFVRHEGLVNKGSKPTVILDGVGMTTDHKVLDCFGEWEEAGSQPDRGRAVTFVQGDMEEVFDLVNCGPRSRFAVVGDTGLVIAHNCVERGHYDFLQKADKCDNFFVGNQWSEADRAALQLVKRPALTINKIISTMSTIMGEQIYNRNEVSFRPAGLGATSEVADALTKVWAQIAATNQLNWVRSSVFADGIIRSRGFYDVRMDFKNNMSGTVRIKQQNSKNVVIDPDAEEYDPDEWNDVFITKWMTYQDIATLYGESDAEYLRDKEESLFPYAYDSIEKVRDRFAGSNLAGSYYGIQDTAHVRRNIRVLERQYRKLAMQKFFVDIQTGDRKPVPDAWDRNRIAALLERMQGEMTIISEKTKRVRWTVTADHCVLHDDWSPYNRFTVVPYFPHFRYGKTVGLVENLIDPQELLNKVSSQELHIVNTTANSGWKVKAGNLVNMGIEELEQNGAQTGLVVELKEMDGLERITPNNTPQGMDRISYKSEEHMKTISGVSDSMQGFDREDVAAKAISAKRQSGQTNLVPVMDNLERSDWFLARAVLDLVQQYYTEERMIHVTGNDLVNQTQTLTVNQYDPTTDTILNDLTLGEYGITITSTPDRATLEDSQFEQARALRELGVQIPDDVLIENSRLQRRSEIVKQMQADKESPEAKKQAELQLRAQEANVSKLEGEAKEKHTKSALDEARAKKEAVEAQNMEQGGDSGEAAKLQQEMEMERERFAMERERHALDLQAKREEQDMKRQEFEMKLAFEREKHQQEQAARAQESEQRLTLQRQQHYEQRAQAAAKEAENPANPSTQPKTL